MTSQWHVIRSKPREETTTVHYLQSMEVTCFYACYAWETVFGSLKN